VKRALRIVAAIAGAGVVAGILAAFIELRPAHDVAEFATLRDGWRASDGYLLDRNGELVDTVRLDLNVRRFDWVALEAMSPALVAAVIDAEDQRFYEHTGTDWLGVAAAMKDQLVHGRTRGASTITMQLAGLIDTRVSGHARRDAWRRKLMQIRIARGIESTWAKPQILEAYLNLLQFRGELQGIGAASRVLAGKAPSGLDVAESVVLAALLPAPSAGAARVADRACARAAARKLPIDCALIRAAAANVLAHATQADHLGPGLRRDDGERLAPHVARALVTRPGEQVHTTLDRHVQLIAREALTSQLAALDSHNVRDGAVIVVDNASGDVLAYVGSSARTSRSREVDGVRALRQAGSTLKPFLYELAFEQRLLTAASLLDDSPIHLDTASGVYLPQDYDHDFKGLVSVRSALGNSLNIPAVRALVLVGVEPFRQRLNTLGYTSIDRDGEYYGYSLALGSAEVSLWEQAQAYRALARGGRWSPIHLQSSASADEAVLHADASFIAADILSDRAARTLTFGLDNHLNTSYWSGAKTGTSKDMRDNWCIGFSSRYTVAVWVGNFEGDSMHDVSGVTGAAPVWQQIMAALHSDGVPATPTAPEGIVSLATSFTPALEAPRHEWFLRDTSTPLVVAITPTTDIARIESPANGMVIAIDPDIPSKLQRLPLLARGANDKAVFKLNGQAVGKASSGVMWAPQLGAHRLVLEDGGKVLDQILFTVR
jgi:penicillin-binding protein 1C